MSAVLVSIIGPPAVGKTTLAQYLTEALPARLIIEDYAGNPFLAASFEGHDEVRLPGQLYFLMSRVAQLSVGGWLADGVCVSDYGFCQDRIFARQRLGGDDLRLYERLWRRLGGLVHPPDVVIRLDASEATLMQRIATRGRAFERAMDESFLADMRAAHRQAAGELTCPVIDVDCDRVDLLDQAARADLLTRIRLAMSSKDKVK